MEFLKEYQTLIAAILGVLAAFIGLLGIILGRKRTIIHRREMISENPDSMMRQNDKADLKVINSQKVSELFEMYRREQKWILIFFSGSLLGFAISLFLENGRPLLVLFGPSLFFSFIGLIVNTSFYFYYKVRTGK